MSQNFHLAALLAITLLTACSTDPIVPDVFNPSGLEVGQYVTLLEDGVYDSLDLPDFRPDHIPTLLEYAEDTVIITIFPRNPVSSFYLSESRVGIYVLWTIESIRAVYIKSDNLVMNFPSKNPILVYKDSTDLVLADDIEDELNASNAYYNWWHNGQQQQIRQLMETDPLEDTPYRWY